MADIVADSKDEFNDVQSAIQCINPDRIRKIASIPDPWERNKAYYSLRAKAKEYGVTGMLDSQYKAALQEATELARQNRMAEIMAMEPGVNVTDFSDSSGNPSPYDGLNCQGWVANIGGISYLGPDGTLSIVSRQPIVPVSILENLETGKEKVTLAFFRRGQWKSIVVPRSTISRAASIVELSDYGVEITSESAKKLVKYLSDVEGLNQTTLKVFPSTSKLGWHNKTKIFLPYDPGLIFDARERFKDLYEGIREQGSYDDWLACAESVRKASYIAPRISLAASFASVLIKPLGILPFVVDIYGVTEDGKTVTLMLATSIWADPAESKYMGDFQSTSAALETKCDALNNLPLILDDTSKCSQSIRMDFERIVYSLCSGKGKSRSDKTLGAERERTWSNVILCNGERAIIEYVKQGGAMNRVIEVNSTGKLFASPREVANTVRRNFGFAGKRFVDGIRAVGFDEVRKTFEHYENRLVDGERLSKQIAAGAAILTADYYATQIIFRDNASLEVSDVAKVLANKNDISEGRACYQYILDCISSYRGHFVTSIADEPKQDIWGQYIEDDGRAYFFVNSFTSMLKEGGYYRRQFTDWARKEGLLKCSGPGTDTDVCRIFGYEKVRRCINLKIDYMFLSKEKKEENFN